MPQLFNLIADLKISTTIWVKIYHFLPTTQEIEIPANWVKICNFLPATQEIEIHSNPGQDLPLPAANTGNLDSQQFGSRFTTSCRQHRKLRFVASGSRVKIYYFLPTTQEIEIRAKWVEIYHFMPTTREIEFSNLGRD